MRVRVKLFAQLRDLAGGGEIACEVPEPASVQSVWDALVQGHPALAPLGSSVSSAVNAEYAKRHTVVRAGDEVAFLPPVSGG
jgi:molybdopterin converting factor subunit 1